MRGEYWERERGLVDHAPIRDHSNLVVHDVQGRCTTHHVVDLGPDAGGLFRPVCETALRKVDRLYAVRKSEAPEAPAPYLCLHCTVQIAPNPNMTADAIRNNARVYLQSVQDGRAGRRKKKAAAAAARAVREEQRQETAKAAKLVGAAVFHDLRDAFSDAKATEDGLARFQKGQSMVAYATHFPATARGFVGEFVGAAKAALGATAQRKVGMRGGRGS